MPTNGINSNLLESVFFKEIGGNIAMLLVVPLRFFHIQIVKKPSKPP